MKLGGGSERVPVGTVWLGIRFILKHPRCPNPTSFEKGRNWNGHLQMKTKASYPPIRVDSVYTATWSVDASRDLCVCGGLGNGTVHIEETIQRAS